MKLKKNKSNKKIEEQKDRKYFAYEPNKYKYNLQETLLIVFLMVKLN